jgi:hypothetical protein
MSVPLTRQFLASAFLAIALATPFTRSATALPPEPRRGQFTLFFLRNGALWRAPVSEGRTAPTLHVGTPQRLSRIPYNGDRWLRLVVSRDGRWVAVDSGEWLSQPDGSSVPRGIWLVQAHPGAKSRLLPKTADPSFSPDGAELAVTRGGEPNDTVALNLSANRWRTLRKAAAEPVWSADGREVAVTEDPSATGDGDGAGLILDARSGAVRFQTPRAVTPKEPILSPNGQYLAVLFALSRPKTGHTVFDRKTGAEVARDFDYPGRLPAELQGWSPDGKYLLWNWRAPDPDNDGSWLWDEVGLTSFAPGVKRRIAIGHSAVFSPDGAFILYLHPHHRGIYVRPADLCCAPVQASGATSTLLTHVDAFALVR